MTIEEIKKALSENKDLAKQVAIYVTSETDSGKELLLNHAKAEVVKAVAEKTAEIYTGIDNDLFEILGKRKGVNEKTYDFLKGLAKEYKELNDKKESLNNDAKIKELQAEIKKMQDAGSVNEHWKNIYDDAITKWEQDKADLTKQIEDKESEFKRATIEADLRGGLSGLNLRDDVPKEAIDALVDKTLESTLKHAKIVEGKVVYHKENGEPYLGEDYKPITPVDIWKKSLGGLVSDGAGTGSAGGGANPNPNRGKNPTIKGGKLETIENGKGDKTFKLVLDPSEFSTKSEFYYLAEQALKEGAVDAYSEDYVNAIKQASETYNVEDLPMN